jgi:hypothetical protein
VPAAAAAAELAADGSSVAGPVADAFSVAGPVADAKAKTLFSLTITPLGALDLCGAYAAEVPVSRASHPSAGRSLALASS